MKPVNSVSPARKVGFDPGNEGGRHIGHDLHNLFGPATVCRQVFFECIQGLSAFAGNRENNRPVGPIEVNKDGDIPMSPAGFGFIGTEGLQTAGIQTLHGGLLKEQGETAALARLRGQDLPDLMVWAANTGHRGADDTVVLKEVEMSPAHLLEIMGVAELPAYWTGEKRARSGCYGEAKFMRTFGCIEQLSGNLPGSLQPQT